jgi:DNA end-binding protein Ku
MKGTFTRNNGVKVPFMSTSGGLRGRLTYAVVSSNGRDVDVGSAPGGEVKSVWKGVISFGLVSIPIRLYAATEERGVALHQVHVKDGGRIRYRRFCTADGEEVPFEDIVRGYELPTGEVVVLTDEDFAELPLSSSRAIDVLSFVDADSLDPVQFSRSYYCEPADPDAKPYILLRDALDRAGKVAMVKVALRQRESLAVLRPRNGILVLQLMLWPEEIRVPRFPFLNEDVWPRPQELQMAGAYVDAMTGEVEPDELVDRYRVALEQLVEAKITGHKVEQPPGPVQAGGVDLMEALRRSVEEAKKARGEEDRGRRSPARKRAVATATQRKATARKTSRPQASKKAAAQKTSAKKTSAKKTTSRR